MFSPETKDLFAAFSIAQGEFEPLGMSDSGQYGPFSTVEDYIKATRSAFKKNGLSLTQIPFKSEDGTDLITVITHSSGQFMRSIIRLNPEKQTHQGFGASITYMRRYALGAILGLDGESEDIDKKKDEIPYANAKKTVPPMFKNEQLISVDHANDLYILLDQSADAKKCLANILYANKIEELEQLPENKYAHIKDYIVNKFKAS